MRWIWAWSDLKRIAIPGMMTSAYLTLRLMEPDFEAVVMPFDKILDAVHDHAVDLGLVRSEAHRYSGHDDVGLSHPAPHGAGLRSGGDAVRQDSGRRARSCGGSGLGPI